LEQTKFTVDSVKDTVSTVQALHAASKEMKTAFKKNKELDLNYIDKMQDDMFDMMVGGGCGALGSWLGPRMIRWWLWSAGLLVGA
jgi:hypothetical protein